MVYRGMRNTYQVLSSCKYTSLIKWTQPATFVATKLIRGMIFTRIRVGELSNLEPWEKIHVSPPCFDFPIFPCFIQPPPLKALLLVGAVMAGSGVWQDCQSLPTCTLHQWIEPRDGKKNDYTPHSILSTKPLFPFSVHLHEGTVVYSFSCTGIFSVWSHAARRGAIFRLSFTFFSREWNMVCFPSVFLGSSVKIYSRTGWESVSSSPVLSV